MNFHEKDLHDLNKAKVLLENPGIVAKMTNLLGTPIEKGFDNLPIKWKENVSNVTQKSLTKAVDAAIFTMKDVPMEKESNTFHKVAVGTSGAIGGFFGFTALAIELPISTTIMLRSIADIARSEGESISSIEVKLACIEVFALGGPSKNDDASESGYFAVRSVLTKSMADATKHISQKGLTKEGSPALVKFIVAISERFGVQVSEKVAAQAIPIVGAIGGATINTLFIDHFQDMARGHFIVRRLEKKYGKQIVENKYLSLDKKFIEVKNKLILITIVAMLLSISIYARTTAQVTADSIHAEQCEQGLLDISQCKSETEIRTGEKAFNDFTHGDRIDIGDFQTQLLDCTKPITNINLVGDYIWSYKHAKDRLIKFSINEEYV